MIVIAILIIITISATTIVEITSGGGGKIPQPIQACYHWATLEKSPWHTPWEKPLPWVLWVNEKF